MEKRIKTEIYTIFRKFGCDKLHDYQLKENRILTRCMDELTSHPGLEKELGTTKGILHYFVMQMILETV